MCICVSLEIGHVFAVFPFLMHSFADFRKLDIDWIDAVTGEITRSCNTAKCTTAKSNSTIPVWTIKSCIKCHFEHFKSKFIFQMIVTMYNSVSLQ